LYQYTSSHILLIRVHVAYDNAIDRGLEDGELIANLVLDVTEYGVAFAAEARKDLLIVLITHLGTRWLRAILVFVLELMERGEIMSCQGLCTGTSIDTWMTFALSGDLVALALPGTTHITATILAAEQRRSIQVKGAISTLITTSSGRVGLAMTIA